MTCNELRRAQKDIKEREEKNKRLKELDEQIKFHGNECAHAIQERYKINPSDSQRGYIFEIFCPSVGWIQFDPSTLANMLHM
jgi:hypothetical protein